MKVLIIGGGGREYSIGWFLRNDPKIDSLFYAPGNAATKLFATNLALTDHAELVTFAKEEGIGLVIVGPEQPLVKGIVDLFRAADIPVFGPTQAAARLEASKAYMKAFAKRHAIPTAAFLETANPEEAAAFIQSMTPPIVVKADGLCAGKGVLICQSHEEAIESCREMLSGASFGSAGQTVVIEEYLDGYELSVFAICDGENYIILPPCQDHKRLKDNDEGPNTGGMGAYCPAPMASPELLQAVETSLIAPAIAGMKKEGSPYTGVLFCGVMVVDETPYLLEYNVRFGDPECEVLMPLLSEQLLDILLAAAHGKIDSLQAPIFNRHCIGVVLASENYPYGKSEPAAITTPEQFEDGCHISYAGVGEQESALMATGGRVLVCVAQGDSLRLAHDKVYKLAESISFKGKQYRKDIAHLALDNG